MNLLLRGIIILCGLILAWEVIVRIFQLPPYILPSPILVFKTGYTNKSLILSEAIPTMVETLLGLLLGTLLGLCHSHYDGILSAAKALAITHLTD